MKKNVIYLVLTCFISYLYSQSASDYFFKAVDMEAKGLLDEAIQLYTIGIKLEPTSYQLYNARGIAYKKKRVYDLAIIDYTKAIQLNNDFVFAYNNRAIAYYFLNNFKNAKNDFLKAIELNPQEGYYYFLNLATALKISKEEYNNAIDLLKKNIELINEQWSYQIAKYLTGMIKEKEFLVKTDNLKERLCEAYFYIAIKAKGEKKNFKAKRSFKKVIKTELVNFIEYEIAQKELIKK